MFKNVLAVTILVLITPHKVQCQTPALETLLLSIEAGVTKLAEIAQRDYDSWVCGGNPLGANPETCYVDGCKGNVQNPTCSNSNLAKDAFGGCDKTSDYVVVDYNKTRITFASDPLLKSLTVRTEIYGEIKWTSGLAPAFNAESNSNAGASWQYIGLPTGMARLFPATLQETCYSYDPRLRPWYVAATSGPKDVVIVIDVSGSMGNNNRMSITKTAVKSVLTTLTINDYVSIVTFQSSSQQLCGYKYVTINGISQSVNIPCGTLVQATALNKGALELFVDSMVASGGTQFLTGIEKAFPLFETAGANGDVIASGCSKALLFLTDGVDGGTASTLYNRINELNAALSTPAVLFTYSLGSGAETTVPKAMACATNGIWSPVADGGNIRDQMSHFYDYFSGQRASGDSRVSWVEPYIDAYGAGEMTTASKAIYDKSVTPPKLVGVLGIDVLMTEIKNASGSSDTTVLIKALAQRSKTCVDITDDACTLVALRKKDYTADDSSSSALFGGSTSTTQDRTCLTDPTNCSAAIVKCAGTNLGIPQTNTAQNECGVSRGKDYNDEVCGGVCKSANKYVSASEMADNAGMVAGIVIGVIIFLCCVCFCIFKAGCCRCTTPKQHLQQHQQQHQPSAPHQQHNSPPAGYPGTGGVNLDPPPTYAF